MTRENIYLKPTTWEEAISLAKENEMNFRYIAGGTDLIINKFQGNELSNCLVDITGIDELKKVEKNEKYLKIGSLVRLDELKTFPAIKNEFPALIEAAHQAASPVIRKTATIGGNILCENRCIFYNQSEWWRQAVGFCLKCDGDICIATGGKKKCFSKFVSDTAPVLIALDALVEIADKQGTQLISLEKIYTGDGILPRNLSKTALIRSILLPVDQRYFCLFKKLRPREAVDFTSLTTAISLNDSGRIRIVLGGVDPKPLLIEGEWNGRVEEYIKLSLKKARIVDNDFYSRTYRREMIRVFLEDSFEQLKKHQNHA